MTSISEKGYNYGVKGRKQISTTIGKKLGSLGIAQIICAVVAAFVLFTPVANAASLQEQIDAANRAASQNQAQANALGAKGDTLANKLGSIQAQSAAISNQLAASRAQQQKLTADIQSAQDQLVIKKQILDENIRTIYQQSQITPIEMIASSKNFSEYVDRQQYLDRVKDHITEAAQAMQKLKADLTKQQSDLQVAIKQQADLSQALAIQQNEQASLLADTRGDEAAYSQQAQANKAQAEKLKAQQAAVLASTFGSASGGAACGGGYPGRWCNAEQDTIIDSWGMYNRECVSYTAFRVSSSGHYMPYWGGRGNANEWPSNARSAGIPVDSNPGNGNDGTVAISLAGPYGHAMYVESVSGGNIHVSQYNYGNNGEYSTMTISSSGLYFIHF